MALLKDEALKSSKILNEARKKAAVDFKQKKQKIYYMELELNSAKFEVVFKENNDLDYSGRY